MVLVKLLLFSFIFVTFFSFNKEKRSKKSKNLFFIFSELQAIGSSSQNNLKSANIVSLTRSANESDGNLTIKIVAASFENDIGSTEVLGEKVWKDFGFFEARKSDYLMEKVIFPRLR